MLFSQVKFIRVKNRFINLNQITSIEVLDRGVKLNFAQGNFIGIPEPEASEVTEYFMTLSIVKIGVSEHGEE